MLSHLMAGNAAANADRPPYPSPCSSPCSLSLSPCPSTTANCANNDRASCANPWNISANSHTRTCTRRNDIRSPLQSTIPGATVLNRMCIPYVRAS
ncbi:hypothetical protein CGMCC3_g18132 [Colletotrichum fructicola]|nr:uncharacterized protein CGMCC3_g18132 [Colletotrichum fructicola]KAE9565683.1 hypothetical protein CGMCC3_g18132 [Colletotrichum fructicola]